LGEAHAIAKSNRALVGLLTSDPERVARGDYRLSEAKPWLFRMFEKKAEARDEPLELDALAPAPDRKPRRESTPEDEELRALVQDALVVSRSDAE
jgi:hypothetical protein